MLNRLITNWVYGGFLAGILLLALTPIFAHGWPPALVATYLCLPAYMLHQYEEHDDDRFRESVNKMLKGRGFLSPLAVFIINVPGVWGVVAVSLWLAVRVNPGFGLIAAYLLMVNAAIHIVHGLIFRRYNPGLATAVLLFVPLGAWCMVAIQHAGGGTAWMHAIGAAAAVGIHAAIIVHVFGAAKNRRAD
ncbi:MAG: HXXEE domain-containing protein [Terracidiphilus sp.]